MALTMSAAMTRTAPAGRTLRFITALSARLTCPKPNARPIRHNGQVPDRNGKIFYTSITSLSHISKESGYEAAHGWRRCRAGRHYPDSSAERPVRLRTAGGFIPPVHTQSLQSSLWITAPIIIGSELLQDYLPINERRCYYAASDPHYFCSEPSQDPYQPLHLKDGDC